MACLLGSCFSDNGNYDYQPPINIRVTGVNEAYTVNPTGDKLQIAPKIYPENRQYDCFWMVIPAAASWNEQADTISRQRNLDYNVNLNVGNYKLRLCAKDRDFFSETKTKPNIVHAANGHHLQGAAQNLYFTINYWNFNTATLRDTRVNAVFVASNKDLAVLDYFTGKIIRGYEELFVEEPARREVRDMFAGPSDVHVYVGDNVYTLFNSRYDVYKQFVLKTLGNYNLWARTPPAVQHQEQLAVQREPHFARHQLLRRRQRAAFPKEHEHGSCLHGWAHHGSLQRRR